MGIPITKILNFRPSEIVLVHYLGARPICKLVLRLFKPLHVTCIKTLWSRIKAYCSVRQILFHFSSRESNVIFAGSAGRNSHRAPSFGLAAATPAGSVPTSLVHMNRVSN